MALATLPAYLASLSLSFRFLTTRVEKRNESINTTIMKEFIQSIGFAAKVYLISRFGILGEKETVTIARLPGHGVTSSYIGRDDTLTEPTPDVVQGIFVVHGRSRRGYTLQNWTTNIELQGVPRRSIRKILDMTELQDK